MYTVNILYRSFNQAILNSSQMLIHGWILIFIKEYILHHQYAMAFAMRFGILHTSVTRKMRSCFKCVSFRESF